MNVFHFPGPEGVFSLLIGSTVKTFAEQQYLDTTQEAMGEYVAGLAVIVGFFSLLLGLARVGFLDNLVSHPIVCGYINACSLLLFIGQLGSFFGIQIYGNFAYDKLYSFFTQIKDTKPLTPLFGITSLAVLVLIELVKRKASKYVSWARRIPTTFIVLVVGVTLSATLNLHSLDVDTLGQFENGFPTPFFPPLFSTQMVPQLLIPGFLVTLVGFVEGMAVYKQFCIDHSYHLSPNRELVAFGLMNMIGGLFRAFPASASMPRSKISNLSGASSQFVGLVASILPLVMVTSAMPVLFFIPKVTISTIIMVAALRLGSWRELVYLIKLQAWNEVVVFWVTLLLTFFLGPEIGIIVAFGMSLFLLVKTSSSLDVAHLGVIQADTVELTRYRDVRKFPLAHRVPGFAILRIDSPLVFINISTFIDRIGRCERLGSPYSHPYAKSVLEKPIHTIILDALNISHIDAQSSLVITETASHYKSRDVRFLITNLRPQLRYKLMVSSTVWVDSLDAIGPDSFFSSLSAAIASVEPNSEFLVHDNHELSSYTALHG